MSDMEKTGMLKIDFLALIVLIVISDCLNSIKQSLQVELDWAAISLDDIKTMELFAEGRTEAIFQFESIGMQEICRKLKPKGLEDLAALNALYRPGPLDGGMVDDFIARHHGLKSVRYIIPEMKEILNNTYGIIVYQEQIMQLAQKLAGYSLGEADLMRRAMGKKNREEMARHEEKFIAGAIERGIKKDKAQQIFSLMAQFADYGFNRSHSVAYAYLAFQTAYLKAHYPEHFYAAVLSNEIQDSAKILKYVMELRGQGIKLLPPDINESGVGFTPLQGAIRYGLAALKGVGQQSVKAIIDVRNCGGYYSSLYDFIRRVSQGGVNKRIIENLICAGALDSLNKLGEPIYQWRPRLLQSIDLGLTRANRAQRYKADQQNDLFADASYDLLNSDNDLADAGAWTHNELLVAEKNSIGFYVTGHPLENYKNLLMELGAARTSALTEFESGTKIKVGGIVAGLQSRTTKKGARFALMRLEDEAGSVKCVLWPEVFSRNTTLLRDDIALLVAGKLEITDEDHPSIIVEEVQQLADLLQSRARAVIVRVPGRGQQKPLLDDLVAVFDKHRGDCEVYLEIKLEGGVLVRARPHGAMRVRGSLELETALLQQGCQVEWLNVTF